MISALKRKSMKSSKKAYTILELTIVILIIALLIALIFPRLFDTLEQAKTNAELSEARMIRTALQTLSDFNYTNHTGFDGSSVGEENYIYFEVSYNGTLTLSKKGEEELKDLIDDDQIGKVINFRIEKNGQVGELKYETYRGSTIADLNGELQMLKLY